MMATDWTYSSPVSRRTTGGVLNLGSSSELTISSGEITVTRSFHTVDTESDAASDDLDTINGLVAGSLYVLQAANDARTVVLKDGTGNIQVVGGSDFSLDADTDVALVFSPDGSTAIVIVGATIA